MTLTARDYDIIDTDEKQFIDDEFNDFLLLLLGPRAKRHPIPQGPGMEMNPESAAPFTGGPGPNPP